MQRNRISGQQGDGEGPNQRTAQHPGVPFLPPAGMSVKLAQIIQTATNSARRAYIEVGHTDLNVCGFWNAEENGDFSNVEVLTTSLWVTPQGEKSRADELRQLLEGNAVRVCVCGAYGPDKLLSFFCYAEDANGQWLCVIPLSKDIDGRPLLGPVTLRPATSADGFHNILYPLHS